MPVLSVPTPLMADEPIAEMETAEMETADVGTVDLEIRDVATTDVATADVATEEAEIIIWVLRHHSQIVNMRIRRGHPT